MTTPPGKPSVAALAAGEPGAFAALFDQAGPSLLRVAGTMLGDRHEAEDVVQDLFVNLARSREKFAMVRDLDAYLFAALRHVVGRRLVRRRRERENLRLLAAEPVRDAGSPAEGDSELQAALAALPVEQREVVSLKVDGGLTFAQIAEVLGISPNTAGSRYRYALEKLREMLEKRK